MRSSQIWKLVPIHYFKSQASSVYKQDQLKLKQNYKGQKYIIYPATKNEI